MTLVRRVARPMLASMFVSGGYSALRSPGGRVEAATPFISKVAGPLHLPDDPELLVRANGGAMLGAGTLFGLGRFPRLSAFILFLTLLPTTYVGHPFWVEQEPAKRSGQRIHFLKNVSMLGALLLATVDTEGKPGLAWRAQRAGKDVRRSATLTGRQARMAARNARRQARLATVIGASKLPGGPSLPALPGLSAISSLSGRAGSAAAKATKVGAKAGAKASGKASAAAMAGQAATVAQVAKVGAKATKAGGKASAVGAKATKAGGKATQAGGKAGAAAVAGQAATVAKVAKAAKAAKDSRDQAKQEQSAKDDAAAAKAAKVSTKQAKASAKAAAAAGDPVDTSPAGGRVKVSKGGPSTTDAPETVPTVAGRPRWSSRIIPSRPDQVVEVTTLR